MKKDFRVAAGKYPVLLLLLCLAPAWLLSSCGLSQKNAEKLYESGYRDLQSGAPRVAIDKFSKAIELEPDFSAAYDGRAYAKMLLKDYAGAVADCDKVIELDPEDERAFLIKGASRFYMNDFKGSRNDLSTAISLNPDDVTARECRGMALARMRDWDKATADFSKAIQLNANDARAYYGRAACEMMSKEYEKALADSSDAIALDDTIAPDAYRLRAHVKSRLKDHVGAVADANSAIELKPSDASGYLTRATIEVTWDEFSDASNDLQTAFGISPTNSQIFLYRGLVAHKTGKFEDAVTDYNRGIGYDTRSLNAPEIYEALGYARADMCQWQPALEDFKKSMSFNSPPDDVRFEAFLIERRLGQGEQAQRDLNAYIRSIPPAKGGDWNTGVAHFLAGTLNETNFIAEAATTAKRATDIPEQTGDAWYYAAMEHLLAGDKSGAAERFEKSLKTGSDNSFNYLRARVELDSLKMSSIPQQ